jgi:hypothetical protein
MGDLLDIIEEFCPNTQNQWNRATFKNWLCVTKWFFRGSFAGSRGNGKWM